MQNLLPALLHYRLAWFSLKVHRFVRLPHREIESLMDHLRRDTERREVEALEGRGRPQQQRDSLSVGGIGNICSGLTAGLPPAASCRQLHTTKIWAGPQRGFQPTVRVTMHLPSFMEERWCPWLHVVTSSKIYYLKVQPDWIKPTLFHKEEERWPLARWYHWAHSTYRSSRCWTPKSQK